MGDDALPNLGELAVAALGGVERALERLPRLRAAERQTTGLQAPAPRARQDSADGDTALAECLAEAPGLRTAAVVEITLRGTVVESRVRGIEASRRKAVAQDDDRARGAQRLPHRLRSLR